MTAHRLFAALATAALSAAPLAAISPERDRVVVRYADLDLASPAGAATLRARVARAVHLVCGAADPRDLVAWGQIEECRKVARDGAMPQVETALAGAQNGHALAAIDVRRSARGF